MMENLSLSGNNLDFPSSYLSYLCHTWNQKNKDQKLDRVELIFMSQKTPLYGDTPTAPKKKSNYKRQCH